MVNVVCIGICLQFSIPIGFSKGLDGAGKHGNSFVSFYKITCTFLFYYHFHCYMFYAFNLYILGWVEFVKQYCTQYVNMNLNPENSLILNVYVKCEKVMSTTILDWFTVNNNHSCFLCRTTSFFIYLVCDL